MVRLKWKTPIIGILFLGGLFAGCNSGGGGSSPTGGTGFAPRAGFTTRPVSAASGCADRSLSVITGSTGTAEVFVPDPLVRSGQQSLSPTASSLDECRSSVPLSNLGGKGVLQGKYVDVRNGTKCDEWYGAFDPGNNFNYSHSDFRFQEAMTYYFGDRFRSELDTHGIMVPPTAVKIIAHCMQDDNAFYAKHRTPDGTVEDVVCLGDSVATPGASYSDDGSVVIHELQHATTVNTYTAAPGSPGLNQLWYDEAGALNEAISDFMALTAVAPLLSPGYDPRVFSRWALGTFIPGKPSTRGANKCPSYDPSYPDCNGYPAFSADSTRVSYFYPDGMGWPYANNYTGPGFLKGAFEKNRSQEEIHTNAVLMAGALWDVYENLRTQRGGDHAGAVGLSYRLVMTAVKSLPQPTPLNAAPVNFRVFASQLVATASSLGLTPAEQEAVTRALTDRGLLGGPAVEAGWATLGPGKGETPGVRIEDNATLLRGWLSKMGGDPMVVKQSRTGANAQISAGDTVAIWFDLKNQSETTAGSVLLTVSIDDPDVTFLDLSANIAPISASSAQIVYGKINGTKVVSALTSANPELNVPTGNTYFLTNPFFGRDWSTAIWVKASATAPQGKTVTFKVHAAPSNGEVVDIEFPVKIN